MNEEPVFIDQAELDQALRKTSASMRENIFAFLPLQPRDFSG